MTSCAWKKKRSISCEILISVTDRPSPSCIGAQIGNRLSSTSETGWMEEAMIPGPFDYHRPATVAEAARLLSTLGNEARPLAGGLSLIPMMKITLTYPVNPHRLLVLA